MPIDRCSTTVAALERWSMEHTPDLAGGSASDQATDGSMFLVDACGTARAIDVTGAAAHLDGSRRPVVFINGSLVTVGSAWFRAAMLAQVAGEPVVLIYMSQGINYFAPNASGAGRHLAEILAATRAGTRDGRICVVTHSWSCSVAEEVVWRDTRVLHIAINPATLPAGEWNARYLARLRASAAKEWIIRGMYDAGAFILADVVSIQDDLRQLGDAFGAGGHAPAGETYKTPSLMQAHDPLFDRAAFDGLLRLKLRWLFEVVRRAG